MSLHLKFIAVILSVFMLLSFVSCGVPENNGEGGSTSGSTAETTTATPTDPQPDPTPDPEPEPKKIKNIIIIIGDGMGPQHIEAGQIFENKTYDFTSWQNSVCNTDSVDKNGNGGVLTDSAASATALATGTLTQNSYLGKDHNGNNLTTILDVAKDMGKSVGVLTTDNLYGATPSGFSAHSTDRNNSTAILATQLTSNVDFLCGLRADSFYSPYIGLFAQKGYYYSNDLSNKEAIMAADKVFLPTDIENGAAKSVALKDAASLAIEYLERDEDGFVLMIEQAHIDKCSHSNDIAGMLARMKSLNETVETVKAWADDRGDTAIIVTADHETGGLSASKTQTLPYAHVVGSQKVFYKWTSTSHTKTMVKIFVHGYDVDFKTLSQYNTADKIKNTDVFKLMKQILEENKS